MQEYSYVYNGGTLMQIAIETTVDDGTPVTETLSFSYDASGIPMSVIYNGTAYYYTVNLQGDVMAIVDASGTSVVSYAYDAWGNVLSVTGTMADTLGEINPLRYRGYVYDQETELYYLQSRYYDPELGRFLNADAFTSTGQGILGNNMFAYCGNNPVNRVDPTGHAFMQMRFDPDGALYMLAPIYWGGARGGGVYGSAGVARSEKTSGTDTTTSNVSNVESDLRENRFSIYKGSAVFSTDLLSGTSAFSFGIIVMGSDNIDHPDFENTLKHEYGHIVHASQIGLTDYFFTTAIPSLMGAALSPHNAWIRENYYNLPWERIAECFGNVNRSHAYGSELAAYLFWIYTLAASAATPW